MIFNDYYDTVTEYEADYSTVLSAWEAGASAMFERLVADGYIDTNHKASIRGELEEFIRGGA